jgi:glycosidase
LTLTLRGIPQLYYGDEIGMAGGGDPDDRRDFPGGWSEDTRNAFTKAGRTPEQQAIFAYVQTLLRLRREHPALATGRLWHLASDESLYVFVRETEEESVLVAFNGSGQAKELRVSLSDTPAQSLGALSLLFGDGKAEFSGKDLHISTPAESVSIYLLN